MWELLPTGPGGWALVVFYAWPAIALLIAAILAKDPTPDEAGRGRFAKQGLRFDSPQAGSAFAGRFDAGERFSGGRIGSIVDGPSTRHRPIPLGLVTEGDCPQYEGKAIAVYCDQSITLGAEQRVRLIHGHYRLLQQRPIA